MMQNKILEATLGLELILSCILMYIAGVYQIRELMIIGCTILLTAILAPWAAMILVNFIEKRNKKGK